MLTQIFKILVCFGFDLGGIWQHSSEQPVLCQYMAKINLQSKMVITSNYQLLKPLEQEFQPQI